VFFQLVNPWTQPARMREPPGSRAEVWGRRIVLTTMVLVLAAAVLVARHNLRKGRGDRRGAFRVSAVIFVASLVEWVSGSMHTASLNDEISRCFNAIGEALFNAGLLWVLYLALEPYVRKFWPSTLVSWSRLVAGNFHDPRVGRDVLIGTACGVAVVLLGRIDHQVRPLLGFPALPPLVPSVIWLEGARQMLAAVAQLVYGAMFNSLWIVFGLVAVNLIVRRVWITAVLMTLFLLTTAVGEISDAPPAWLGTLSALAIMSSIVLVALRFGLLATVTLFFVNFVLGSAALTLESARWFFPTSATLMLMIAALAVYGFVASRAGEPLLGRRVLD
jgi:serine/threonine-protein kinase